MEQNGKAEKPHDPSSAHLSEGDTTTRLLSERGIPRATRKSEDAGIPKEQDQAKLSSSLKELRRLSRATVWDIQKPPPVPESVDIVVYRRRWIMLTIVLLYGIIGTLQWSLYSIIANVITKYYNVSNLAVDFTCMIFLITFICAFLPVGWIIDTAGLRWSLLLGTAINMLGCLLRVFSVPQDRFWLTMLGQTTVGLSQVFVSMLPVRVPAVWFPAGELSFALSVGNSGILIGSAVGFILSPLLVRNSDNLDEISADLNILYMVVAGLACILFILAVCFFQEKPPLPPSSAQQYRQSIAADKDRSFQEFVNTLKRILGNKSYLILMFSYSCNVGVYVAICTLLNQVLIPHFPGHEKEIGFVGLLLVASAVVCSSVCGYILDRTHAYKTILLCLYSLCVVGWISFSIFIFAGSMTWVLIATAVLGAAEGNQSAILDLSIEVTFPEPEGLATGTLIAAVEISGVTFTLIYGLMLAAWGDAVANGLMLIPLILGSVGLMFMRPKLNRLAAQKRKSLQPVDIPLTNKTAYTGV